jgi:hypothetical protein
VARTKALVEPSPPHGGAAHDWQRRARAGDSLSTLAIPVWEAPALLAGAKTVVRHGWTARTARRYRAGQLVLACTGDLRQRGRPLAILRLTGDPVYELLAAMPSADYAAEGWAWLYTHPEALWRGSTRNDFSPTAFAGWRSRMGSVWVIRFAVVATIAELVAKAKARERVVQTAEDGQCTVAAEADLRVTEHGAQEGVMLTRAADSTSTGGSRCRRRQEPG